MREGYIFQEEEGEFLTKDGCIWYHHSKPEKAWVHPRGTLEHLRAVWEVTEYLKVRPVRVYPATWSPKTGVKITGEPFDF